MKNFSFLLLGLILFSSDFLRGQQSFREDQVYLDINFILQGIDNDRFIDNGFSRSIHVGVLRDIFITPRGDYSFGVGLGYGWTRLVNNLELSSLDNDMILRYPREDRSYRNFFTYHELQLPLEFRWRKVTIDEHKFWRIHAGYRLIHPFGIRYKPFFGPDFGVKKVLSPLLHEINIAVGYNTWNLRFAYSLNPLFRSNIRSDAGDMFSLRFFQMGLIFYLL